MKWTVEEIEFLKETYPVKGRSYCVEILGRTEKSVQQKAYSLKLKSPYGVGSTAYTHEHYVAALTSAGIEIVPLDNYVLSSISIRHKCKHGHVWEISPNKVLAKVGCPYCYGNARLTTVGYISKLPKHISLLGKYKGSMTPIQHLHTCGNSWMARPHDILKGSGCPHCSTNSIKNTLPCTLYLIKWDKYYKIGITSKEIVSQRFKSDWNKFNMELLWEIRFPKGKIAYTIEQNMLKSYKHLIINTGLLISGNTETLLEEIPCPV